MLKPQARPLRILIYASILFCSFLIVLSVIDHQLKGVAAVIGSGIVENFSLIALPLLLYILAEVFVAVIYIAVLWYVVTTLAEFLVLSSFWINVFAITLWCLSTALVLAANAYYVPHSFFAGIIRSYFFHDALSDGQLQYFILSACGLLSLLAVLSVLIGLLGLLRQLHVVKHVMAFVLAAVFILWFSDNGNVTKSYPAQTAKVVRPNVFIISFDALNRDRFEFFNPDAQHHEHFDNFLDSSVVFADAYTPLARTFPSWASILSGRYPLHNKIRQDNNIIDPNQIRETLVTQLRKNGYKTIFAADDNRFSDINKQFGFEELIGDQGNVIDYLLCDINDFPLSNLLIPTKIGKQLFPYNYANHGAAFTYDPHNFLTLINHRLAQLSGQPVFMAIHLNLTGFPWQYFNDQGYGKNTLDRYQQTLTKADAVLAELIENLQQKGFLEHAIVVLISDHGATLGQPHDRSITANLYQGVQPVRGLANETSFGYGGDLLSLKQYQPLLAFKGYGVSLGNPHRVSGSSIFLDITPTLLDLLNLPQLSQAEGISLKSALLNPQWVLPERPIYLETAFINHSLTKADLSVDKIVAENVQLFQIDAITGLVSIKPNAELIMQEKKQRGILQGDWLLAYFPARVVAKLLNGTQGSILQNELKPAYSVLLNTKTGIWTTEMDTPFAKNSPVKTMIALLQQFYGDEMDNYQNSFYRKLSLQSYHFYGQLLSDPDMHA
jgi:hypothetical protein